MKKQPKLILRESAVLDMTRDVLPGSFVEMGAGTGHMAKIFLDRGFHGACHDIGESSRRIMRRRFSDFKEKIRVVDDISELSEGEYDYLLAFEVLEHVLEDRKVLQEWVRYLKPGGLLIASVPAHQRKFGKSDEIVGHVRRYEKEHLRALLNSVELEDVKMINYGYPITELTRALSNKIIASDESYENLDQKQRSIVSAQSKPKSIQKTLSFFGENLVTPFCYMQRWFYRWDFGDGLVATAKKKLT
ncbi:class I SAM-dependent methyltransferase [Delftia acidovorans]|uniref:class I SAM-dependent methyltransferase n=1 Tax=Delftia acidovorans TaxID=80866 RepID=UPI00333ED28C